MASLGSSLMWALFWIFLALLAYLCVGVTTAYSGEGSSDYTLSNESPPEGVEGLFAVVVCRTYVGNLEGMKVRGGEGWGGVGRSEGREGVGKSGEGEGRVGRRGRSGKEGGKE